MKRLFVGFLILTISFAVLSCRQTKEEKTGKTPEAAQENINEYEQNFEEDEVEDESIEKEVEDIPEKEQTEDDESNL
ncbi:hypothetical protein [Flavivirga sp. 57AJ16]|uniref:hypothetical protein n=1 Tax=Flavivirga sp. 57AJ16 TaxID=3025307 RepID=UPI002365D7DB|nr:hypothetical protein [Flavivirga sp. 57AJ16]MDD7885044.1 hypothetical protein [Flavivirga sp. 57AJ16]